MSAANKRKELLSERYGVEIVSSSKFQPLEIVQSEPRDWKAPWGSPNFGKLWHRHAWDFKVTRLFDTNVLQSGNERKATYGDFFNIQMSIADTITPRSILAPAPPSKQISMPPDLATTARTASTV
jgi:hypothetical protein